jgi:hypothetical protein
LGSERNELGIRGAARVGEGGIRGSEVGAGDWRRGIRRGRADAGAQILWGRRLLSGLVAAVRLLRQGGIDFRVGWAVCWPYATRTGRSILLLFGFLVKLFGFP